MAKNLPGLNYDSKLNIDDLSFQSDEVEKAILDRTAIVFGSLSLTTPRFGIIDLVDPRNIVAEETTRPLLVYASTLNPLNVNITAGSVVTPNGAIAMNTALIEDFQLARTLVNDINIIYIENEIIDAPPVRKTRYNVNQYTRRIQSSDIIRVSLLTDFQNNILFPPTRRKNIVVLAVISVATNQSASLEIHIDYSANEYTFNRPWYSPVDIEHRSKIGSGVVTDQNTHALTFNDLSSGNLTLYDQILDTGMIQARDDIVKGVCGTPCYEIIDGSIRITSDGGTGITSSSRYYVGSSTNYITLAKYPVQITAFYLQDALGRSIAWDWIKGTRIVVLPNTETFAKNTAIIWYNRVYSLEPPAQILSNTLTFEQPDKTKELIITGGVSINELTNQFIDFDGSSAIPRNYTIYAQKDGSLLRTPQLIQTTFLLDDIGLLPTTISASIFGPAKISVGLAGAGSSSSMAISVQLQGRDIDGNSLTEVISFSGSTWEGTNIPAPENKNQYITSTNVFTLLNTIQITSRSADSPNSKIQLWAELETGTCTELNKLAKAATVTWDGTTIFNNTLKDQRKITKVLPPPIHRYAAAAGVIGLGGTSPKLSFSEDFATPILRDTTPGYQTAIAATTRIDLKDITKIITTTGVADTITFPNGSVVTAMTGALPNRTLGYYAVAGQNSDSLTRDDLITTINFPAFNSGYAAVADTNTATVGLNTVIITPSASNLSGSRGNGIMATSNPTYIHFVDSTANDILGLVGGIDAFGGCFIPHHMDYIDTDIPSASVYDVTSYRNRYQSVALPINGCLSVKVVVHGVDVPQTNVQLRTRVAIGTDPTWLPWEVITGVGALFTITKSSAIKKIQLQIFGKASGFSLYEV